MPIVTLPPRQNAFGNILTGLASYLANRAELQDREVTRRREEEAKNREIASRILEAAYNVGGGQTGSELFRMLSSIYPQIKISPTATIPETAEARYRREAAEAQQRKIRQEEALYPSELENARMRNELLARQIQNAIDEAEESKRESARIAELYELRRSGIRELQDALTGEGKDYSIPHTLPSGKQIPLHFQTMTPDERLRQAVIAQVKLGDRISLDDMRRFISGEKSGEDIDRELRIQNQNIVKMNRIFSLVDRFVEDGREIIGANENDLKKKVDDYVKGLQESPVIVNDEDRDAIVKLVRDRLSQETYSPVRTGDKVVWSYDSSKFRLRERGLSLREQGMELRAEIETRLRNQFLFLQNLNIAQERKKDIQNDLQKAFEGMNMIRQSAKDFGRGVSPEEANRFMEEYMNNLNTLSRATDIIQEKLDRLTIDWNRPQEGRGYGTLAPKVPMEGDKAISSDGETTYQYSQGGWKPIITKDTPKPNKPTGDSVKMAYLKARAIIIDEMKKRDDAAAQIDRAYREKRNVTVRSEYAETEYGQMPLITVETKRGSSMTKDERDKYMKDIDNRYRQWRDAWVEGVLGQYKQMFPATDFPDPPPFVPLPYSYDDLDEKGLPKKKPVRSSDWTKNPNLRVFRFSSISEEAARKIQEWNRGGWADGIDKKSPLYKWISNHPEAFAASIMKVDTWRVATGNTGNTEAQLKQLSKELSEDIPKVVRFNISWKVGGVDIRRNLIRYIIGEGVR